MLELDINIKTMATFCVIFLMLIGLAINIFHVSTYYCDMVQQKKQTSIVSSSTKSKYIVILKIITKAIRMYMSLYEFRFPQIAPTTVYFDNQSVIAFTTYSHTMSYHPWSNFS
jgi:hypothetical protein